MDTIRQVPTSHRKRHIGIVIVVFLVLGITIVWLVPDQLSNFRAQSSTSQTGISNSQTLTPDDYQMAHTLAKTYMDAFLKQDYSSMWSVLAPEVQTMWPSKTSFAIFWQTRFQHYTLQDFHIGQGRWLSQWVNPETMIAYTHVLSMSVSLQLQPDLSVQQHLQAPPEAVQPSQLFQNLPFIMQRVADIHSNSLQWLVLAGGPADLEAPILPPVGPISNTISVPILMYHHISDAVPTNELELSLTVTTTHFREQLDYLQAQGYHTITFNQFFDALYYGGPLPSRPIILSFDDGYIDAYQFALPLLQAHGFSAMFYIITGKVGWDGYMNWQQLRNLLAVGMQIGSHTVHHVDMGVTLQYSVEEAQQELQQSQASLQKQLGVPIQQFCYPSGEPFRSGSLELQQQIVVLLAQDGYVGATTDPNPGVWKSQQDSQTPFALVRIRVDGPESLEVFMQSVPW